MQYFSNNRTVNFNELRESGIYSDHLLDVIENGNGNYNDLEKILSDTDKENRHFMEPLLYAVKNEKKTYGIYTYCGKPIKEDIDLAKDIIIEEPELIEGTPISNNMQFILEAAEINPNVVIYMSSTLKDNPEFVGDLCKLNNKEITENVAKKCKMPETIIENPNLSEDKTFMTEVVKENPQTLEYASDKLKNDYDFMKEVSKNKDTIDYVVNNIEDFGENGLSATKDALVEMSSDEAILGFEEEQEKVKKQIEEKMNDREEAQLDDKDGELEELLKRDKQLKRHARFFERIKNGEIDPVRAAKLMDKICVNLDENYREEIKKILKLDEAILEKQKETKEKEDLTSQKQEVVISVAKIEEMTQKASHKGIKEETEGIRGEIIAGIDKIGEKTNEDDGART